MSFYKKVIVLKQLESDFSVGGRAVSGIVRIETENGVSTLFLSLVNFAAKSAGEYYLFLSDSEKRFWKFPLGKRPCSFTAVFDEEPRLSRGFAAGVCYLNSDLPVIVAFQRSDECRLTIADFKKAVAAQCAELRKQRLLNDERPVYNMQDEVTMPLGDHVTTKSDAECLPPAPSAGLDARISEKTAETTATNPETLATDEASATNTATIATNEASAGADAGITRSEYDDEAVATENFYELDESIILKTELLKEAQDERLRDEDFRRDRGKQEKVKESESAFETFGDETNSYQREGYSKNNPFFATVKDELAALFEKFPEENSLIKLFPDSVFVRINYSSEKYYVVGVIKEKNAEKYVCYGVPAAYSETPPKELDGYCSFIPVSIFDMKGDGFWMMFQDATTGECIKPR